MKEKFLWGIATVSIMLLEEHALAGTTGELWNSSMEFWGSLGFTQMASEILPTNHIFHVFQPEMKLRIFWVWTEVRVQILFWPEKNSPGLALLGHFKGPLEASCSKILVFRIPWMLGTIDTMNLDEKSGGDMPGLLNYRKAYHFVCNRRTLLHLFLGLSLFIHHSVEEQNHLSCLRRRISTCIMESVS